MNNNQEGKYQYIEDLLEGNILQNLTHKVKICYFLMIIVRFVLAYQYSICINPIQENIEKMNVFVILLIIPDFILFCLITWLCAKTKYFIILHFFISNLIIYIFKEETIIFSLFAFYYYFIYCKYKMAICILDCSQENKNLFLENQQSSFRNSIRSILDLFIIQPYVFKLLMRLSFNFYDLLYFLTTIISSSHYIYLNHAQQKQTKNQIQKQTYQIFLAYAIINPPWINLNIFIDKNQQFYQRFVKCHLIYKIFQAIIIFLNEDYYYLSQNELIIKYINAITIIIYIMWLLNLQISNDNMQQINATYYQLMYKKSRGQKQELMFFKKWIQQNNIRLNKDVLKKSNFIELIFKPVHNEDFKDISINDQIQDFEMVNDTKIILKSIEPNILLINSLFLIYNLVRYREEDRLYILPNFCDSKQVNNYLKHLKVALLDINPNNRFKEINLHPQQQLDFSSPEFIFFLKFLDIIFESPLVQITSNQQSFQNICQSRYILNLSQFYSIILFQKIDYLFPFPLQIIFCDLFEEYLL